MKNNQKEPKQRQEPRISVNKLGEYIEARPARKRTILKDQKQPKEFITNWYNDSFDPLVEFFTDPEHPEKPVFDAISAIESGKPANKHQKDVQKVNIEALQSLLAGANEIPFANYTFRKASQRAPKLVIAGVDVSVRPELEVVATTNRSKAKYGMLKLYLNKTTPLTPSIAEYVGTLVHMYAEQKFGNAKSVHYQHCLVYDVFAKKVFAAPQSFKMRRKDIEAACESIAAWWPQL